MTKKKISLWFFLLSAIILAGVFLVFHFYFAPEAIPVFKQGSVEQKSAVNNEAAPANPKQSHSSKLD